MSKEIPEFQRSVGITPSGGGLAGFPKAVKPGVLAAVSLGNYAAQIAQNASNQQAIISGAESYKQGNRALPAFTKSDAEFNKAYQIEEMTNVSNQASKFINESYLAASKNPTSESLNTFAGQTEQGLLELIETASPLSRAELSRDLLTAYQSSYNKLAGVVENNNKKILSENSNQNFDESTKNIINSHLNNTPEQAEKEYSDAVKLIDVEQQKGIITEAIAKERLQALKINDVTGKALRNYQEAKDNRREDEFISNFAQNKPSSLTPLEHLQIVDSVYKYHNQLKSYLAAQSHLNYLEMDRGIKTGDITSADFIYKSQNITRAEEIQLLNTLDAKNAKDSIDAKTMADMSSTIGSPFAAAKFSNKDWDKYFDHQIVIAEEQKGEPLSFAEKSTIAASMPAQLDNYTKSLSKEINFGNPASAAEAASALFPLVANNKPAVSGLDDDTIGKMYLFNDFRLGMSDEEAIKLANDKVNNMTPDQKKENLSKLDNWLDNKGYKGNIQAQLKHIGKELGVSKGIFTTTIPDYALPAGITEKYKKYLSTYAELYGNPDVADSMAIDKLKQTYNQEDFNNRNEVMAIAPSAVWKVDQRILRSDMYHEFTTMVEELNKLPPESQSINKIELEPGMEEKIMRGSGDIYAKIDGKRRKLVIDSDLATQVPAQGLPSWPVSYVTDEGIEVPIMDLRRAGGGMRWQPTEQTLEATRARLADLFESSSLTNIESAKHLPTTPGGALGLTIYELMNKNPFTIKNYEEYKQQLAKQYEDSKKEDQETRDFIKLLSPEFTGIR